MFITFSGLDGAGKTTLTACARQWLMDRGYQATILHFPSHVGTCAISRRLKTKKTSNQISSKRSNDKFSNQNRIKNWLISRYVKISRFYLDAIVFWGYLAYFKCHRHHILIMDRYFYDWIVDFMKDNEKLHYLLKVIPKPTCAIFVDVLPEVAFHRKPEYSVEHNIQRNRRYKWVLAYIPMHVMSNAAEEAAKHQLYQLLTPYFCALPRGE